MKWKCLYLLICLIALSCNDDFLDTSNPNEPDLTDVLENPAEWEAIIEKQFSLLWQTTQNGGASLALSTMADVLTSSWRNWGMKMASDEPREALFNITGNTFVQYSYFTNFKIIGSANDVLRALEKQPDAIVLDDQGEDIRIKLKAAAIFLRGMAYGNMALKYDQAQYVTEDLDVTEAIDAEKAANLPFLNYDILMDNAFMDLDNAISIASQDPQFTMEYYNGVSLNLGEFNQLIHSFKAKFMVHLSRNDMENLANDWQSILIYAKTGINFDFSAMGDGGSDWWDDYKIYVGWEWLRVDHRIIAVMAENTLPRFPEDNSHPLPEPVAIDYRLISDMSYLEDIGFPPTRGLFHFSHYTYTRYRYHSNGKTGKMPFMLKAENDLMIAEALIRTNGDRQEAATLINITRVGRGHLTELTGNESDQELLDAIMHERFIELLGTNGGQPYYDRRRLPDDDGSFAPYSGLQPGTAHQFPVPARELNILGMEVYTFPK